MATDAQKTKVKEMLVKHLRLRMEPGEIADQAPLFGEEGLGLDSVDAIELVSGVEQAFSVVIGSEDEARKVFVNVDALADYLVERGGLS